MPKRRSKRNTHTNEAEHIDTFFSSLSQFAKITKDEQNNLKKNSKEALDEFISKPCHEVNSACTPTFFEDLIRQTGSLADNYSTALTFWLNRIFYLHKTVDSFSKKSGIDYLKKDDVEWGNTFKSITNTVEKSANPQATIDQYKRNLFMLRNELIGSFTSKNNHFSQLLQNIDLELIMENANSAKFDLPIAVINKIKEFDTAIFCNIQQGMKDPYNVVDDTRVNNQIDNALTSFPHSAYCPSLTGISAADAKLVTGSVGGAVSQQQSWIAGATGVGLGAALTILIGGLYSFFNQRHQQPATKDSDVEANKESMPLVPVPKK